MQTGAVADAMADFEEVHYVAVTTGAGVYPVDAFVNLGIKKDGGRIL